MSLDPDQIENLLQIARKHGVLEMQCDGITFSIHPAALDLPQPEQAPEIDVHSVEALDESDEPTFRGIPLKGLVGGG